MKYIFDDIKEIKNQIEKTGGVFLFLDFDGVLSAIAPTPNSAFISRKNKTLVKTYSKHFPTAVITGRTMADIKKKINLKNILYIASHGLEWEENGKKHTKSVPIKTKNAINLVREKIKPLIKQYPGVIFEDKILVVVIHFRGINPKFVNKFKKEVMNVLEPIVKNNSLRMDIMNTSFEIRPEISWDKGHSVLFAEKIFSEETGKKFIPIYIGDSVTDEDAFIVLEKRGISIRVGKSKNSKAKWYLQNQKEVEIFLEWLLSLNS